MSNKYDQYLLAEVKTIVVLLSVLVVLAIVIICFGIKYLKNQQKNNAIACCGFSLILIVSSIASYSYLDDYIFDLKDQAYVRYEGEFYVEDAEYDLRAGAKPLIKFSNSEHKVRYKVCDNTYLHDGYHSGYIVYSQRSKIIVEWYCSDCN